MMKDLVFYPISDEHKEFIDNFDCSDEPLVEEFLKEKALIYHEFNCAKTRLYFDTDQNLIGFFTLCNDVIEISNKKRKSENWYLPHEISIFPSIKLLFLGVDRRFRRRGYGEYLLDEVIRVSKQISELSGCTFLVVESLENSIGFYVNFGFVKTGPMEKGIQKMILKLDEV